MLDRKIDDIVKLVVSEVNALQDANQNISRAHTAVLKTQEKYEIEQYDIPELKSTQVLVRVEGCCLSFDDTVEFLKEKKGGDASACGQYGTGKIIKTGSAALKDAMGNSLNIGDSVVGIKSGVVKSAIPNSWYSDYMVFDANTQLLKANSLELDSRLIMKNVLEIHNELVKYCKANNSTLNRVVIFGCRAEALLITAILKSMNYGQIIVVGDDDESLGLAKMLGALETFHSSEKNGIEGMMDRITRDFGGKKADKVILCTDKFVSKSVARRFAVTEDGVCDLSHLINKRIEKAQKYEDSFRANVSSYSDKEYKECLAILENAEKLNLPLYRLITHRYILNQINEAHWAGIREEGLLIGVFNR